ncbi:MAG: hypothetical protein LBJ41_01845 [Treponema sp.]|jgi:hypothetical protein|nr:hypothetical protein [Treponema sp.]
MKYYNALNQKVNGAIVKINPTVIFDEGGQVLKHEVIANRGQELGEEIIHKIKNDALPPSSTDLADLQALSVIDAELQADDMPENFTDKIVHTADARAAGGAVTSKVIIQEMLDPVGIFQNWDGTNDRVPLMYQPYLDDTLDIKMRALGWKDTKINELANPLFDFARVTRAAARAYVYDKNAELLNPINGATYGSANKQAADTTGSNYFDKIFNTLVAARGKLGKLTYKPTNNIVSNMGGKFFLLANPVDVWTLTQRNITSYITSVREAFPDIEIVPVYTQSLSGYGKDKIKGESIGITAGTAYLIFVPTAQESLLRVEAVDLDYESGFGSVLTGKTREDAWFRYTGLFTKYFLPADNSGNGLIIQVTLPALS